MIPADSLLNNSGQGWKIKLSLVLGILGGIFMAYAFVRLGDVDPRRFGIAMLAGVSIIFASSVWACLAIVCPKCKTRLMWKAIREQPGGKWYLWLLTLKKCPVCGST